MALVSAQAARALDDDLPPLVAALDAGGIPHETVDWDDPAADWASYALAVVRSPWNYARTPAAFLRWVDRAGRLTRLENPPAVLRWSADKRYLSDLDAAGVPVVPTSFAARGETMDWPDAAEIVVKPAISAGSLDTTRYRAGERARAQAHVERLHAEGRVVMAQPYLSRVEGERGETALVYLEGSFSHAVRKGPMLTPGRRVVGGLFVEEDIRPAEATAAERELGAAALAAIPAAEPLLYARVDLVPDGTGAPVLLELELVEPSLFLAHSPSAADRLAEAIAARLTTSAPG